MAVLWPFVTAAVAINLFLLGLIGIAIMLFARRGLWGTFVARTGVDPLPLGHAAPAIRTSPGERP